MSVTENSQRCVSSNILALLLLIFSCPSFALSIQIDYSLDDNGFFDPATENGLRARHTLESVADFFSGLLTDQLTTITSSGNNRFTAVFQHPSDQYYVEMPLLKIPEDTLIIFVGSRDLEGSMLGYAGVGGYIAQGHPDFLRNIANRGQSDPTQGDKAEDFAPWGGYLSFDSNADWYFDNDLSQADVPEGQIDFYSNALHEFGHLLGIGTSDSWFSQTSLSYFDGTHSAEHFNDLIPLDDTREHWAQHVNDSHKGTSQAAALTPALRPGERKEFTALDIAALEDVGWDISQRILDSILTPAQATFPNAIDDFNQDGHSDLIWKNPKNGQVILTQLNWKQSDSGLNASLIKHIDWMQLKNPGLQLIASTQLNDDGFTDLLWWNPNNGELSAWFMEKQTIKSIHRLSDQRPPDQWKPVAVMDFDNDGQADIIWWNQSASEIEVWYIDNWESGQPRLAGTSQSLQSKQADNTLVGAADFDNNQTPDLIFVNNKTGQYTLWSMKLDQVMSITTLPWKLDKTVQLVATKDFNRDTIPDLLLQANNPLDDSLEILTLITLQDPSTPLSQTDLRFAIPDRTVNCVN
ncbi:MAG: FG-GAP-like repeat-containing protein [Gammaproteobacteria bacterium]|nr:FG-GAP-like repeat-containing protein [Gammaproteobacteria bacterium]